MSTNKFLLKLPQAQAIVEDVVSEQGQFVERKVKEIISALVGVRLALEVVSNGEKVFEVWSFRRRLEELRSPKGPLNDATFIVMSTEEKEFLIKGVKSFDWTLRGQANFWIRWPDFFAALADIQPFDEKNPPIDYVEWKTKWDEEMKKIEDEKREAEEKALAAKREKELAEAAELSEETMVILADTLDRLKEVGKLGPAATIEDIPEAVRAEASLKAKQNIEDRKKNATETKAEEKPVDAPAVIETAAVAVPETAAEAEGSVEGAIEVAAEVSTATEA
jgi:hypothetical protein